MKTRLEWENLDINARVWVDFSHYSYIVAPYKNDGSFLESDCIAFDIGQNWTIEKAQKFLIGLENYLSTAISDSKLCVDYQNQIMYFFYRPSMETLVQSLIDMIELPQGLSVHKEH